MLSVGKAMEAVFAKTPSPSLTPQCSGMQAEVSVKPDWAQTDSPSVLEGESGAQAAERLSVYTFEMHEKLAQDCPDTCPIA